MQNCGACDFAGTPITFDERNVGEIRSVAGDLAMALLKIASVKDSNARKETLLLMRVLLYLFNQIGEILTISRN